MERVEYEKLIIQELVNLHKNNELDLSPWYQRRSVWTEPQKAYLINTLFEQKPIPSLYVRHSLDVAAEKSVRQVVDGQQRIRTILEYVDNQFAAKHPERSNKKVLYKNLSRAEQEKFKFTSLSVGYLLGATDSDVIEIFGRLNSVAKSLNSQERRNAQFSGEFKQFCLSQAALRLPLWRNLSIFTANDIARMYEVQFVSDLALNFLNGLSDYSSEKLDKIYHENDVTFSKQTELNEKFERVFGVVARLNPAAVRDTIFARQPLFFSLCLVLDSVSGQLNTDKIEKSLHAIDEIFNADPPRSKQGDEEASINEFINACKASTQRIKSRQIRDTFIKKFL
jgi:hypothetical protein